MHPAKYRKVKHKMRTAKVSRCAKIVAMLLAFMTIFGIVFSLTLSAWRASDVEEAPFIRMWDTVIHNNREDYFNPEVMYQLPSDIDDSEEISIMVTFDGVSLLDAYEKQSEYKTMLSFSSSAEGRAIVSAIEADSAKIKALLEESGIEYEIGHSYETVMCGFEVVIEAGDFKALANAIGDSASLIVSEEYEPAESVLIENTVNVYETGIFNTEGFGYDGSGVVVAVLDTGLDYTHSAFSLSNFTSTKLGLTIDDVKSVISETEALKLYPGLTAEDVYLNDKVPFAFDYADADPDVFPIKSEHGTHVSGIILGKDDTITGVAPNAQLVSMKVFSDKKNGARNSWIIAALEDCVVLGVDVINMSLGMSCGFSRATDKDAVSGVYDRIKEAGINLVVAASNDYSSSYGSQKNGNLPLTSNPDSATVGSPATYPSSLAVASISGVKTPYFLFGNEIMYFTEASDRFAEEKHFFDEYLAKGNPEDAVFVTIPGVGRAADYTGIDVKGKIALVKRGDTTFEEKANTAEAKGAAAVIIYNNVSGDIHMSIGEATIPVCSLDQNNGELLAAVGTGTLKINANQTSGPFMSDFSSWGPTPDLEIKPEITAHGGSILSAVPGQDYDRLSGTSMASPNMAGFAALLREYVIESFPEITEPADITALCNRLFMSTADVVYNTNGLPYSVRKQGAGLANLVNAAATDAVILTYKREDGSLMDKTKIELGDDPSKTGVYTLKFGIQNFGDGALSYDVSAIVMTEGVGETKTHKGDTNVTEEGYILSGATVSLTSVTGGEYSGNTVTVAAGATAEVTVTIKLSDADKKYLNDSFKNGMYVEGFVELDAKDASAVDLSAPYLAFYGDWTQAPLFDIDYFETNADEIDDSIDTLDKTLPDSYATRPIGSTYLDYIVYLGAFPFIQDPSSKLIGADRKYIALSNDARAVNAISDVWLGLLRNAASVDFVITDDTTGEVIYEGQELDVRKSHGLGGISPAFVDIDFSVPDHNLKNNTQYTVTLTGRVDYDTDGADTNLNNTFTFPFVTDFEAPSVTGCEYYTEYDRSEKKTKLFAKIAVYDNHYAMGAQVGYVYEGTFDGEAGYGIASFGQYATPIYSEKNSTSYVVVELTDYIDELKEKSAHKNTFTFITYDYALNEAYYEIALPDDYTDVYFEEGEEGITLNPYEVYELNPMIYPGTEWSQLLDYEISDETVARVVRGKLIALKSGTTDVKVYDPENPSVSATLKLTVRAEGDEGYMVYDKPIADKFDLTGFTTEKAFYYMSGSDRDIGDTGDTRHFGAVNALKMFPSEAVVLNYILDAYFPDETELFYESSNENIVTVDENGRVLAIAEGFASISVRVMMDGKSTYYSESISVEVKDPWINSGSWLTNYFGNGGVVEFPENLIISEISDYAFSNYHYIEKGPDDEISDDDPYATKPVPIGENTITKVIIPEGVERIGSYAFANMTALEEIVLPSTLVTIDIGAFSGCTKLRTVTGIENVKFININAFSGCDIRGDVKLNSAVAISDYAFANNANLKSVVCLEQMKSIGAHTFDGCSKLETVTIAADEIKLGQYAFANCSSLDEMRINAVVIPTGAFSGASSLSEITLGKSVESIGELAFAGTALDTFNVEEGNKVFKAVSGKKYLTDVSGSTLLLAAPTLLDITLDDSITAIGAGAFSGNVNLLSVSAPGVVSIGSYAFADCIKLSDVEFGAITALGIHAFEKCAITSLPDLSGLTYIPDYAFYKSALTTVNVGNGVTVGAYAFSECQDLHTVTIGDDVTIGDSAFKLDQNNNFGVFMYKVDGEDVYFFDFFSSLTSLTIGKNANIGEYAFLGAVNLPKITLGEGATIGDYAFYNSTNLVEIDLSKAIYIGDAAFASDRLYEYTDPEMETPRLDGIYYVFHYYNAKIKTVDLSSATHVGVAAFAFCSELESVKLNPELTTIKYNTFMLCSKLKSINLENVTEIGSSAFSGTALESVDLSSAVKIDAAAFYESADLVSVKLSSNNNVEIDSEAFYGCTKLATVENMSSVTVIGDRAFAKTAITEVDLSSVTDLGDGAFAKTESTEFKVKNLGESLVNIGENPFAYCIVEPFSAIGYDEFNGNKFEKTIYTYDISETVTVIDGSLYRRTNNGLEFITYTGGTSATVAEGTVRISAYAFAGTDVASVSLPYSLRAIGHMAFYDCEKLGFVSFASLEAPILEEEYDFMYFFEFKNFPGTGDYTSGLRGDENENGEENEDDKIETIKGLEILPYFMWNVTSITSNVFYGANFVDRIGHKDCTLSMVYPANGEYYDSFIYSQYFDVKIVGATAPKEETLAAIEAIKLIPDRVSLSDRAVVEAARAAYAKINTVDQQALVTEYAKLTQAEKRISELENMQSGEVEPPIGGDDNNGGDEPPVVDDEPTPVSVILAIIFGIGFGVALAAAAVFAFLYFKKSNTGATVSAEKPEEVKTEEPVPSCAEEEATEQSENAAEEATDATDETENG